MLTKKCPYCDETKPLEDFKKDSGVQTNEQLNARNVQTRNTVNTKKEHALYNGTAYINGVAKIDNM